jgi:hypothetical protein
VCTFGPEPGGAKGKTWPLEGDWRLRMFSARVVHSLDSLLSSPCISSRLTEDACNRYHPKFSPYFYLDFLNAHILDCDCLHDWFWPAHSARLAGGPNCIPARLLRAVAVVPSPKSASTGWYRSLQTAQGSPAGLVYVLQNIFIYITNSETSAEHWLIIVKQAG